MVSVTNPSSSPILLAPGDWQVSAAKSDVSFETRVLSGLLPLRGRFAGPSGDLHVDADRKPSGNLLLDAERITTGITRRDRHLRSADFLAVATHPQLTFVLDSLRADTEGALGLTGTLHVRGHAIAIDTPVQMEHPDSDRLRMSADFPVGHRASGLGATGPGWKHVPEVLTAHVKLTLTQTA